MAEANQEITLSIYWLVKGKGAPGGDETRKKYLLYIVAEFNMLHNAFWIFRKYSLVLEVFKKLPKQVWKILDVVKGNMAASDDYSSTKNHKHIRQDIYEYRQYYIISPI